MKTFMFIFAALLLVASMSFAQSVPVPIPISATVVATPLAITAGELTLDGLMTGHTYYVVPDGAGAAIISPVLNAETVTATETVINGDFYSSILVSFTLPNRLYEAAGGTGTGYVDIAFNGTSASWGAAGAEANFFDPHNPVVMALDGAGNTQFVLGGIFTVPKIAMATAYVGEAYVAATYTGL